MKRINTDFYSAATLTTDEAALYWGDGSTEQFLPTKNKKNNTQVKKGSFSGVSNITDKKIIEVQFNVYSQTYNKVEFVKTYHLETYLDVFNLYKKYELLSEDTISYIAFLNKSQFKYDRNNYLKLELNIPLHLYKKHTIMDLNNETSDFEILPRGV